ncbi:MAG TPA: hypothetical protein VF373_00215 [Prolixibacteraceae bacterium]
MAKKKINGSLHIVVKKRKERIAHQNLLSSSRTGSSLPAAGGLFHSMKRKQKSRQNEPSAGRFDGPLTRSDQGLLQI